MVKELDRDFQAVKTGRKAKPPTAKLTAQINPVIDETLREYCKQSNITISAFTETALRLHLEHNQVTGLTVLQKQILDKIETLSDYAVETLKDIKNYEGIDNDIIKYRGGKK